jgi:hypothetical protein
MRITLPQISFVMSVQNQLIRNTKLNCHTEGKAHELMRYLYVNMFYSNKYNSKHSLGINFVHLFCCSVTPWHEHAPFLSLFCDRVSFVILKHDLRNIDHLHSFPFWRVYRCFYQRQSLKTMDATSNRTKQPLKCPSDPSYHLSNYNTLGTVLHPALWVSWEVGHTTWILFPYLAK